MRKSFNAVGGAFALLAVLPPALAHAQQRAPQCFWSTDYQAFAALSDHAFYVRTTGNRYFRVELKNSCPAITYPNATLIMKVTGSDQICGPVDWDLRVGQSGVGGIASPCIVSSQIALTAEEVAAIPRGELP